MNLDPIFVVLLKALIICFFLMLFRIIGKRTASVFIVGVLGLFYLKPDIYIAETLLKNILLLYFAYVFVYSIFRGKLKNQIKQTKSYFVFFLAMVFYNSVLMILLKNQQVSFVLSAVFFFFIEVILHRFGKNKTIVFLGKNKILFYIILDAYFIFINYSTASLTNSFILLFAYFGFNIITSAFVVACPTNELMQGNMPAEFVIKEKIKLKKQNIPMFVNSFFRQKIMNSYFDKKEIISPLRPLTKKDIEKLKAGNIEFLKIQKTINLFIFVVLGIIFELLFLL